MLLDPGRHLDVADVNLLSLMCQMRQYLNLQSKDFTDISSFIKS